jgi:hypothetical protein
MIRQALILSIVVGFSSSAFAAQVCLDQDEFAGLIQRVEQTSAELKNVKAQLGLYQKANDARKEEIRVTGEYIIPLEHYKEVSEELITALESRHAEDVKKLEDMEFWRNAGWAAAAIAVGALVFMVVK